MNYSNIKTYVESKINVINTLSSIEASQVAVMAFQLSRFNQAPTNMAALMAHLQTQELAVNSADAVKAVTILLGAASPSKAVIWKSQEFLSSGTFSVPNNIAGGLVYVTGCGGGGSGRTSAWNSGNGGLSTGGAGGQYVERFPISVSAGESVPVVVGAGGASIVTPPSTTGSIGNSGGDSAFKTLTIKGGEGGIGTGVSNLSALCPKGGFLPGYFSYEASVSSAAIFSGQYIHGQPSKFGACGRPSTVISSGRISADCGGAAGYFGDGTDGASSSAANVTAANALPNTGAGGGSAGIIYPTATRDKTCTSGAGGSGRIIVEWQEFV